MARKTPLYGTGMVFGVFDGLHAGHKNFLTQAQGRCKKLIVAAAHEQVVKTIKGHLPRFSFEKRAQALRSFNPDANIILGDPMIETWSALKTYRPDIVFLGYDQQLLAQKLKEMHIPFLFLDAHLPKKYKSSILHESAVTK
ncbi:MAG: adenylyltransferase/cytidyltransferase family protein [Candidatus Moraniibacteriota bacterium]